MRKYSALIGFLLLIPLSTYCQEVRFLIDNSGSMKASDPQHLTIPALNLIAHLLPEKNTAGIWQFSNTIKNLVPLGKVTSQWREKIKLKTSRLSTDGEYTNIGRAIESVSKDWFLKPTSQERIIVLLTDGKIDLSRSKEVNLNEKKRVIEQLIPKLNKHNISIYTIGLSNNIDKSFLKQLAFRTNGTYQFLKNPSQLQDSFYAIFNSAVNSNEVPIIKNQFVLDSSVSEVTLLLLKNKHKRFSISLPNGHLFPLNKAKVYATSKYTFVTIKKPSAGKWTINGLNNNKNRAIILSNIGLATRRFSHNYFAGEHIVTFAYLTNHGKRITNEKIISNTKITMTPGDSKELALNPPSIDEINYRKAFYLPKNLHGDVNILFNAKSKTFDRIKNQLAHIEPFPYKIRFRRRNGYEMQVYITIPNTKILNSSITADINYPTKISPLTIKKYGPHKYYAKYPIMCINEHYEVSFNISGQKISGDKFKFEPVNFKLECRTKAELKSYFETVDANRLKIKKTALIKKVVKKIKEKNTLSKILPIIATFSSLAIISVLILQVLSYRRRKLLNSILITLHSDEDIESNENNDAEIKEDEK